MLCMSLRWQRALVAAAVLLVDNGERPSVRSPTGLPATIAAPRIVTRAVGVRAAEKSDCSRLVHVRAATRMTQNK
jgi:hypothetical protein